MVLEGVEGKSKSLFEVEDILSIILSRLPRDLAESVDHNSRSCGVKPGGVLGLYVTGYRLLGDFIGVGSGREVGGEDGGEICIIFGSFLQILAFPSSLHPCLSLL